MSCSVSSCPSDTGVPSSAISRSISSASSPLRRAASSRLIVRAMLGNSSSTKPKASLPSRTARRSEPSECPRSRIRATTLA